MEIKIKNNSGNLNFGNHVVQRQEIANAESLNWKILLEELAVLRAQTTSKAMLDFVDEAEEAAKEKSWARFQKAAKDVGKIGLEVICKTSAAFLAELVKRAMQG